MLSELTAETIGRTVLKAPAADECGIPAGHLPADTTALLKVVRRLRVDKVIWQRAASLSHTTVLYNELAHILYCRLLLLTSAGSQHLSADNTAY